MSCLASLNIFIYSGSNGPSVGPKVHVDSFEVITNTSFAISGVDVTYFMFASCRFVLFLTATPNNSDRPFRRTLLAQLTVVTVRISLIYSLTSKNTSVFSILRHANDLAIFSLF